MKLKENKLNRIGMKIKFETKKSFNFYHFEDKIKI